MLRSALGKAVDGRIYRRTPSRVLFHPIAPAYLGGHWGRSGKPRNRWRKRDRDERGYRLALDANRIRHWYVTRPESWKGKNAEVDGKLVFVPRLPPWDDPGTAVRCIEAAFGVMRPINPLHPLECLDR
eukprot:5158005-Alexandrium_andersonii.AAC.1